MRYIRCDKDWRAKALPFADRNHLLSHHHPLAPTLQPHERGKALTSPQDLGHASLKATFFLKLKET